MNLSAGGLLTMLIVGYVGGREVSIERQALLEIALLNRVTLSFLTVQKVIKVNERGLNRIV